MSVLLSEVLSAPTLKSVLTEDSPVEEIVENLYLKGAALANIVDRKYYKSWEEFKSKHETSVDELAQLEGVSQIGDDKLVVLVKCPMAEEVGKLFVDGKPPAHFSKIINGYMNQNPGSNAILHPGCIAHQVARQIIVNQLQIEGKQVVNYYQLACRSGATGKVVYDDNGLNEIGMSKAEAEKLVTGFACLYVIVSK
jgi:hypothetical protein